MTTTAAVSSALTSNWTGPKRYLPAVALGAVCIGAALTPVGDEEGQVLCPYRILTGGGWCPGCGGTRAVRAMVQGDLHHAYALNPWAMLVLLQAVVVSIVVAAMPERAVDFWKRGLNRLLIANAVVAISFWIVRMIAGAIPLPFS